MGENKEVKIREEVEIKPRKDEGELIDLQEAGRETVPREVKTWMEKVESNPAAAGVSDQNNQPLLTPTNAANPKVQLPITKKVFTAGFKKKITEAGRWLSTFFFRIIKIHKGKVKFKEG